MINEPDPQVGTLLEAIQAKEAQESVSSEKMRYVFESEKERRRLEVQAALFEPFTTRFLASAGLSNGMSILDVGTGVGDVAFLAADMVGTTGRVLGIDCEDGMISRAQQRAQAKQVANIQFQSGSLLQDDHLGKFDFVIGRLVTAFQPDQVDFLRRVVSRAKVGGSIALMEAGWNLCGVWTNPAIPMYDELIHRSVSLIETLGFDPQLGSRLTELFALAGLGKPSVTAEHLVGGPDSSLLDYSLLNLENIFSTAREKGLEAPDEAALKVTCAEIRKVATASHVQFSGPCVVGAFIKID